MDVLRSFSVLSRASLSFSNSEDKIRFSYWICLLQVSWWQCPAGRCGGAAYLSPPPVHHRTAAGWRLRTRAQLIWMWDASSRVLSRRWLGWSGCAIPTFSPILGSLGRPHKRSRKLFKAPVSSLYPKTEKARSTAFLAEYFWKQVKSSDQAVMFIPIEIHIIATEYTEWRLPVSGVHPMIPIMMEKSALAGEGGGCTPTFASLFPSCTKLQCTLLLRGQIPTLSISSLPYVYSVFKALSY